MKKMSAVLVLLAGIFWGMIGLFVRRLDAYGFESMDIVALRAITTTILLGFFLLIYDKKKLHISLKDAWCFVGTGLCSIAFFNYCYFKAITVTSLSVAAILLYTAPAIVMVLSALLFHEKITRQKIIALVLTFVGCVFVTGVISGETAFNTYGVLLGLGAGLGYALYSIFSRCALERGYDSLTISFYTFVFAMFGAIPFANYNEVFNIFEHDWKAIGFCLLFGLISTVLPYIFYTTGLQGMENGKAAIIASIEPVVATVLGFVAYHEKMEIIEILGAILVLLAILFNNIVSNKV